MQIGQPCLVTILLNPTLLDSAVLAFHVQVQVNISKLSICVLMNLLGSHIYELDVTKILDIDRFIILCRRLLGAPML